ncbi:hypothetical protein [Luteibacter yeojuensis]
MLAMTEENFNQRIDAIKQRYQPAIDDINARAQRITDDYHQPGTAAVLIGVDIKVEWKNRELSLDLPSVKLYRREFSLDLPNITSSRKQISFDVPTVRMVNKEIGKRPEWYSPWKMVWTPIIISVPETYMRRVEISLDLPEVRMDRKQFSMDVPEFSTRRFSFSMKLPEITVINVKAQTTEIENKGKQLEAEATRIAEKMTAEINTEIASFRAAIASESAAAATDVSGSFDAALGTIKQSIDQLVSQGCDPIKVPTDSGDVNLRKLYDTTNAKRSEALAELATAA